MQPSKASNDKAKNQVFPDFQFSKLNSYTTFQMWTLGYHQCRYAYRSADEVKEVIAKMDEANFPMDAVWLDIDYAIGKKYFTWNPETFSNPIELQQTINSTNRKLVTIIDPHIKVEDGYYVYDAAKGKYFVKDSSGNNDYTGNSLDF